MSSVAAQRKVARLTYALSWLALTLPWLSGNVTIPYDAKALFQAQLQFLSTALNEGQSPFWNPYVYLGFPQISDPQSLIFSPAILLSAALKAPSFQVLDVYVMVLLGLGGFAILSLCQDKAWHPAAASIAAVCFMFGGTASWRLQHIGHIQSYVAFAFSLWLILRVLLSKQLVTAACSGLAVGLMLVEPDQVALLGLYALAVICLSHLWYSKNPVQELFALMPSFFAAAAVCIAVAAIPIAMTYFFLQQSNRPVISLAEAAHGSLHPASLLTFLVSDLFGAKTPSVDYWGPYSPHWDKTDLTLSKNMCQFYFGALPALLMIGFGVVRGHLFDKEMRPYSIILGLSILYAIGRFTPAYALIHYLIPGVSFFRRPVDAIFIAGAMLSIQTGYLAHLWLSSTVRRASHRQRAIEIASILCLFITAAAVALWQSHFAVALIPMSASLLWVVLALLFLLLPDLIVRQKSIHLIVVLVLLLTFDLGINNGANGSTGVPIEQASDVLLPTTTNETIAFLKNNVRREVGTVWRDRVEMLGMGFDWQNCQSVHRLESTLGYNPFRIGLVSQAIGARDYNVGADQRTFSALFPSYTSPLADILGLRFVVSRMPIAEIDTAYNPEVLKLIKRTPDGYIYENAGALPRVLVVADSSAANFDNILRDGRWPDGFDPRRTVLFDETNRRGATYSVPRSTTSPDVVGDVTILKYNNDFISVRVETRDESFLVLNDVWHPWWVATVDSIATPVLRANVLFRAVHLKAGTHVVQFEFRPFRGAWNEVRQAFFAAAH